MRNLVILLSCTALGLINAACQHSTELERISVSGIVESEAGAPINGMISFIPDAGTEGPAATASLGDGIYKFDKQNGPVAGLYRVLIVEQSAAIKAKGIPSPDASKGPRGMPREWSFKADVSPDDTEFDFRVSDESAAVTAEK